MNQSLDFKTKCGMSLLHSTFRPQIKSLSLLIILVNASGMKEFLQPVAETNNIVSKQYPKTLKILYSIKNIYPAMSISHFSSRLTPDRFGDIG